MSYRLLSITISICYAISICHHGGRPRFLAAPPLTLNFAIDGVEGNIRAGEKPFKAVITCFLFTT